MKTEKIIELRKPCSNVNCSSEYTIDITFIELEI